MMTNMEKRITIPNKGLPLFSMRTSPRLLVEAEKFLKEMTKARLLNSMEKKTGCHFILKRVADHGTLITVRVMVLVFGHTTLKEETHLCPTCVS